MCALNDEMRFAVLMYQLLFAEEVRCKEAVDQARREWEMMQNSIYLTELVKALNRQEYYKEIAEKVFDFLRSFRYNGDCAEC